MATIGNLAIKLQASGAQFMQGVSKAAKATQSFGKSLTNLASVGNMVKGALGGLAIGGLFSLGRSAIKSAAELARTARMANSSVDGFAALQHGMRGFGGDVEAVARGMEHLNQLFSGIGPEANYAGNLLSRFGVDLQKLGTGDSFDAVKKIADAVAATNDPLRKATIAAAAFGGDFKTWLPILDQGAAGIDKLAEQAKKMGLTFDQIDATNLEKVNGKLDQMSQVVTGISRQSAVELANTFDMAAGNLGKISGSLGSVGDGVHKVARVFKIAWDAILIGGIAVVASLTIGFVKLFEYITSGLQKVFGLLAKLPDIAGGDMFKSIADSLQNTSNIAAGTAEDLKASARAEMQALVDDINKGFDKVEKTVQQREKALDFGKALDARGSVKAANRYQKVIEGFGKIFEENQTPLQKFQDKLNELNKYLQATGDFDTYARGVGKILEELEKAEGLADVKLPTAMSRDSAATQSYLNHRETAEMMKGKSPQERLEKMFEASRRIEELQLEQQKRMADALQKLAPPQTVRIQ